MPAIAKFRNGLQVGEVSYRKPTQGGPRPLPGMPEMCESASLIFQFLKISTVEKLHKPHVIRFGISTAGKSSRCLLAKSGALIDMPAIMARML